MRNVRNTTDSVPDTFQRGDRIEVEVLGGALVERMVWDVAERYVMVCTEQAYDRLARGESAAQPVAFPIEDVRAIA